MDILEKIKNQIKNNKIIIYMKGTPDLPMCGFSARAIQCLKHINVNFKYVNILENDDIREKLPVYSNFFTFPQIFINSKLIGGSDILTDLIVNKEIENLLN